MTAAFPTTQWSLLECAGVAGDPRAARRALDTLLRRYWAPLYGYLRRHGQGPEDAADLVQSIFTDLIERDRWHDLDRQRGRFRSYLLACTQHWLANEHRKRTAHKRGSGVLPVSLAAAEAVYARADPALQPDALYHQSWAECVLKQALDHLRAEYHARAEAPLFEALKPYLTESPRHHLAALAAQLGKRENSLRVALHRLRKRYGETLRSLVADTVAEDREVDAELRALIGVVAANKRRTRAATPTG